MLLRNRGEGFFSFDDVDYNAVNGYLRQPLAVRKLRSLGARPVRSTVKLVL